MIAYLAAPIDTVGRGDVYVLRRAALDCLNEHGFAVYQPELPFHGAKNDAKSCYEINDLAQRQCDVTLALYPSDTRSVGVPMEVQGAYQHGQPVAVVGPWSMQLEGMGIPIFEHPGEAVLYLKKEIGKLANPLARLMATPNLQRLFETRPITGGAVVYDSNGGGVTEAIKWTGDEDAEPQVGYEGDAGFDLYVSEDTKVPVGGFADVPHGICIAMPPGHWGLITGRSSTIRRRGLLVVNGIIDNGYRGPLFAAVQNLSEKVVVVEKGERLAQLLPFPLTAAGLHFEQVEELPSSDRGVEAFGSTGA